MSNKKPIVTRLEEDLPNDRLEPTKYLSLKRSVQHEKVPQAAEKSVNQQGLTTDQQIEETLKDLINNCDHLSKLLFVKQYRPESQYTALFPDFSEQAKMEFRKLLIELESKKL